MADIEVGSWIGWTFHRGILEGKPGFGSLISLSGPVESIVTDSQGRPETYMMAGIVAGEKVLIPVPAGQASVAVPPA